MPLDSFVPPLQMVKLRDLVQMVQRLRGRGQKATNAAATNLSKVRQRLSWSLNYIMFVQRHAPYLCQPLIPTLLKAR